MKKLILTFLGIGFCVMLKAQQTGSIQIQVNAAKPLATVTKYFNGTNIEDLNNQTNGGVFSQLIHGEAFQENVDIDFLNLPLADYVKVFVILDEMRRPHFFSIANAYTRPTWNSLSEKYDFNSRDIYAQVNPIIRQTPGQRERPNRSFNIGPLKFYGRFMAYDSIPENIRKVLLDRINGNEQISRYWSKVATGSTKGQFELKRGDAYMGRQDQIIRLQSGEGEFGINNKGLNKQGIHFVAGKPYDGILRVKAQKATTIYLSLRDENGKVLAEAPYTLKGDGTYEKVSFELTPNAETKKGQFGITLKNQGEIELGFAFLEPGEWGRAKGLPVRKEFADALIKQGIKAIRYNGSMVDVGADIYLYRWKKMIGPIDERRVCFRSGFNPYATFSFGLIEALKVAEAIDAKAMLGMSIDETYEDIRDFVEYINGSVTTKWGKLRADQGHPAPFNQKHIEVHNEQGISRGYIECMKKFAEAAWEVDPEMHIVASLNIGSNKTSYQRGTPEYALASEIFGWFISKGKANNMVWDPHYSGEIKFADDPGFSHEMGMDMQAELAKDYPGYKLTLCPMEENGSRCDWDRGLAHAHNWNTLQRNGNAFTWLGTANTFQSYGQDYMWNQGRIHFTANEIWFQPSAYIDEKMSTDWLPNVVEATSSKESVLDVTAKINDQKDSLSIYVVNLSDAPQSAVINVADFKFSGKAQTWVIGDCELTALNTVENKKSVAPITANAIFKKKDAAYTFPKYSYTIITLKK